MLIPIIKATGITKDAISIVLADQTGVYNVTTNPGGYGGPNAPTPPTAVGFRFRNWKDTNDYLNVVYNTPAIIAEIIGAGRRFDSKLLALNPFMSGVHHIRYYPFEESTTIISLTQNSKVITRTAGSLPNTYSIAYKAILILNAAGIVMSNVLMLDPTVAYTATTFAITTPWALPSVTGYTMKLATEADLKVIFPQLADKCITGKIGDLSLEKHCDSKEIDMLTRLLMWKFSAQVKFDCKDYTGADSLLRAAYAECSLCPEDACKTC